MKKINRKLTDIEKKYRDMIPLEGIIPLQEIKTIYDFKGLLEDVNEKTLFMVRSIEKKLNGNKLWYGRVAIKEERKFAGIKGNDFLVIPNLDKDKEETNITTYIYIISRNGIPVLSMPYASEKLALQDAKFLIEEARVTVPRTVWYYGNFEVVGENSPDPDEKLDITKLFGIGDRETILDDLEYSGLLEELKEEENKEYSYNCKEYDLDDELTEVSNKIARELCINNPSVALKIEKIIRDSYILNFVRKELEEIKEEVNKIIDKGAKSFILDGLGDIKNFIRGIIS